MEIISDNNHESTRHGVRPDWVPWQVPRKKKGTGFFEVLVKNLRQYCEDSSLVGCRYFIEPKRPWIERGIWVILYISTFVMLEIIVKGVYVEYQKVPVVTVVVSDNYPSNELEFPGIAICNINRISRRAAMKLANEIVDANITDAKFNDVLRIVKQLGNLYEETVDLDENDEIYLDEILKKYISDDYDVTTIMKDLTPNCEDALVSCQFQGEAKNCSDIFVFRKTQHGFCCTFNYIRESDEILNIDETRNEKPTQPYNINTLGARNGLSLVMEPFIEDYYYPIFPIVGWKLTIFNARDYPDNESGSVSETILSPGTESFVELDVTSFYSSEEIRNIEIERRRCIFENELEQLYTGYTYSDCLVDCRAAAIWETCKCRPFYLPRRGKVQFEQKVCNTGNSECLYEHRKDYWNALSSFQKFDGNESSHNLSLNTTKQCRSCYPACDDIRYHLQSSKSVFDKGIYNTELMNKASLDNQSIVHIYFGKHGSVRLKQEDAYYWYELLSNIGGICGVFIGFSFISVVEFVYFVLRTLVHLCLENTKIPTRTTTTIKTIPIQTMRTEKMNGNPSNGILYWNEFLPHYKLRKTHNSMY